MLDYLSCAAECTQSCHIRWRRKRLNKYAGTTYYTLWLEENRKTGEDKAVWQQLEMTAHVSGCILPDQTEHWGVLSTYSLNYWYCCAGKMSTLGLIGGVTSKRDCRKWHTVAAASCCKSLPKQPSSSHPCLLSWVRVKGMRGEGEGKVGSDHSAAISLKKQLVWRAEAAAGCNTWIRTSLVIDCTAVLSFILLYSHSREDWSSLCTFVGWKWKSEWTDGRGVFCIKVIL